MSEQFKLVPVDPTPEMIGAYLKAQGDAARSTDKAWGVSDPKENFKAGFAAMLAAAPTQGADARPVAIYQVYWGETASWTDTTPETFALVDEKYRRIVYATRDATPVVDAAFKAWAIQQLIEEGWTPAGIEKQFAAASTQREKKE